MAERRKKDRHTTDRHTVTGGERLWEELGEVVGDSRRSEVTRRLWAAFLKRPGAKIPRRKDYENPQT